MIKYAVVVADKRQQKKDPLSLTIPSRAYVLESIRNEEDLERRIKAIENSGGTVIAIGNERDNQYLQRAKLAVVHLIAGKWTIETAKEYLREYAYKGA